MYKMPKRFEQYALPGINAGAHSIKQFRNMYMYTRETLLIILGDNAKDQKNLKEELKNCKDPMRKKELHTQLDSLKKEMKESYNLHSENIKAMNRGVAAFIRYTAVERGSENIFVELQKDEKARYYFVIAWMNMFNGLLNPNNGTDYAKFFSGYSLMKGSNINSV